MNTSEVAKLLGVSTSTVQRWVKQLELPMERNERGHYHFNSEDIEVLKKIHEQLQNGTLIQEITPIKEKKVPRRGAAMAVENHHAFEDLTAKVSKLEIELHSKADSVVSYQLLQHRREIEDLQSQVNELTKQLEQFQKILSKVNIPSQLDDPIVFDSSKGKRKKKNIVNSLFGFL